jgi:EmrB/QacA subfamily drug resistance transporter
MGEPRRPGLVLAVCSLATFLAFLDVTIVNIAFPAISREFGGAASLADLSWVFGAYNIVFAALLIPAGRAADLFGRRRIFLIGLVLFAVASAVCALAPTAVLLVLARVVQAVAAALLVPTSLALLLPAFPPERRGTAVGTWGAMGGIAAATGPALGGLLVDSFGWRAVFLVNVPVVAVTLVAGWRVLAESRDRRAGLPDPLSVLLLGGGVALVSLAIVNGEDGAWTAPDSLGPLVAGLAAIGLFGWRSTRVARPLVAPELFRIRAFSAAVLGYLVFSGGFYAILLSNVLVMTGVWGYPTLLAGIAVTPGPIMAAVGSTVGGRLADRFGARPGIVVGGLAFGAGCLLFATRMGPQPEYVAVFLPATLLTGIGVGLVYSGLAAASVARLPAAHFGTGSAVGNCARQIGAVLGIAVLLSALAGAPGLETFRTGWLVMTATALVTAACGVAVGRTLLARPSPVPVAPSVSAAPAVQEEPA